MIPQKMLLFSLVLVTWHMSVNVAQIISCPARCDLCSDGIASCGYQSLTAPPKDYPNDTTILDLEGNHIRVLGASTFNSLPSLEILKIPRNKITALRNDAFSNFANLVTIDLTGNRIRGIQRNALRNLSKLRTLALNRNRIRSIIKIFHHCPNLYQLNMAKNKIRSIGEKDLQALTKAHYIDFRDNIITTIHKKAFKKLTTLRYLFLNNNPIVSLPTMSFGSQRLQLVDFSHCKLVKVPQALPASVGDFRLGNNQLAQVNHTDFTSVTELRVLTLNDNQLQFLADGSLSHLESLNELWLRNNGLVYIPRNLPDNLRRVYMDSNSIQEIEAGLFSNESRLDFLTVENNQIARIAPGTFVGLHFLNVLNFQGNLIQHLEPRTFSDLGSLSTILMSGNPLKRIEEEAFHQLANLSILQLSHVTEENFELDADFLPHMLRLQHLSLMNSPGLAQALMNTIDKEESREVLHNMTNLDLSFNTLKQISPRVQTKFPNLKTLALDGNPLRCNGSLKWLADWMKSSNVNFFNNEEPVCHSPWPLRGLNLKDVRDDEWARPDNFEDLAPNTGENSNSGVVNDVQGDAPAPETDLTLDDQLSLELRKVPKEKHPFRLGRNKKEGKESAAKKKKTNRKGKGRKYHKSNDRKKGRKDRQRNKDKKRRNKMGKGNRNKREAEVFLNDEGIPLSAEINKN